MRRATLSVLVALVFGGCYHATINTGVAPGDQQIHEPWAKGFIAGLVPPETVNAMEGCGSSGVARVETQQSFMNGLVSILTLSIFTPMDILVTCGAGEDDGDLPEVTTRQELESALSSGGAFLVPVASR